jgi:hypothetical protein
VPGSAAAEALLPDSPARSLVRRVTELSALDRLDEAERLLREATLRAIREGTPIVLSLASAVPSYWRGHWDDIPQQAHGVAALIAAHRGDSALAEEMLAVNGDDTDPFAGAARALLAEQHGEFLAPPRDPQWLPDAVRCALAHGRTEFARSSAAYCDERAAAESSPARAHVAALRCRALLTGDPDPALQAAAHDEASGRPVERAAALEDAAVLLAAQRGPHEAASAAAEARAVYTRLDARWDLRRAEDRLAEYGITTA